MLTLFYLNNYNIIIRFVYIYLFINILIKHLMHLNYHYYNEYCTPVDKKYFIFLYMKM